VCANEEINLLGVIVLKPFTDGMKSKPQGGSTAKSSMKVLDQGTKLLTYLATKEQSQLTYEHKKHLIPWRSMVQENRN
jgi:hypothetical protein